MKCRLFCPPVTLISPISSGPSLLALSCTSSGTDGSVGPFTADPHDAPSNTRYRGVCTPDDPYMIIPRTPSPSNATSKHRDPVADAVSVACTCDPHAVPSHTSP